MYEARLAPTRRALDVGRPFWTLAAALLAFPFIVHAAVPAGAARLEACGAKPPPSSRAAPSAFPLAPVAGPASQASRAHKKSLESGMRR
jgi:hypothetical protein